MPFITKSLSWQAFAPFNFLPPTLPPCLPHLLPFPICTFFHKRVSLLSSHPPLSFAFQGNVTFHCSEAQPLSVTFRRPDSFLTAPADLGTESFSVRLQIRTWNREGLIVIAPLAWEPLQQLYLRLILQLQGGRVLLSLDSHANPPTHVYSGETEKRSYYGNKFGNIGHTDNTIKSSTHMAL